MSKTIELKLVSWSLDYEIRAIDIDDEGEKHYSAMIRYRAIFQEKTLSHGDRKSFMTFEKAKEWIDRELQDNEMEHPL